MKRIAPGFVFTVFLSLLFTPLFASHTVTYFQGNKTGAVSLTLDDGYQSQVTTGLAQLNARHLKGTFFVITGNDWINSHVPWATWQAVAAQGHEIGSHTVDHLDLTTLSSTNLTYELSVAQSTINQEIPSQSCISFAYPDGSTNATVQAATATYYVNARTTWSNEGGVLNHYTAGSDMYGTWQPINFYDIGSQGIDVSGATIQPTNLATILDVAVSRNAWASFHFHEIQNGTMMGQFLDLVLTKNVWVDTFGNISRYMKERLNSTIQVVQDNSAGITLHLLLNASLPTATYNVPLTLRSTVPASWTQVKFQQGNSTQTLTPATEGTDRVVYYNAVPGSSNITLTPAGGASTVASCDTISPGYRAWSLFLNPGTYGVFNFSNTMVLPSQANTQYTPQNSSAPGWVNSLTANGVSCQHTYVITLPSITGNRFPSVPNLSPMYGVAGVLVFTSYANLALPANWWLDPNTLAKIDAVAAFIPGVGVFGVWEK
jgi:hypothetical protein